MQVLSCDYHNTGITAINTQVVSSTGDKHLLLSSSCEAPRCIDMQEMQPVVTLLLLSMGAALLYCLPALTLICVPQCMFWKEAEI